MSCQSSEFETQKRLIEDCLINDLDHDHIGNLHDQFDKPVDENAYRLPV